MENNSQNKAKFFAQYWGQPVYSRMDFPLGKPCTNTANAQILRDISAHDSYPYSRLELKSLSLITDEDAYGVGILVNCWSWTERKMEFFEHDELKETHIDGGKLFANSIGKEFGPGLSHPFANNSTDILAAYDFLRSKGYALPFNTLSVDKLQEYGWLKLITK